MKDMIEQIISTDKKSQESVEKAKQLRIQSTQKISDIREKKRSEYLEKARANIKVIEQEEKVKAKAQLKQIESSYNKIEEKINSVYTRNYELWVDELVKRVIEG